MTQDTLTWYGVPSTIPSHGGNSTGVLPAGVLARVRNCGGSFFIAYWRVLEIARVGKGEGVYPPPQKILDKHGNELKYDNPWHSLPGSWQIEKITI